MRRVSFFTPRGGLSPEVVSRVLQMVEIDRTPEQLAELSPLELQLVYDYATRITLAASDNRTQQRPRPTVLDRLAPAPAVLVDVSPS